MKFEEYDILIVGGGPSGSTAAHWAAKHNFKAVIIDQKSFPRDKICGDGLPVMTFELLNEINLNLYDLPKSLAKKVNAININTSSDSYQLDSTNKPFFNIARKDFDNFLWSAIPKSIAKYEEYRPIQIRYDLLKGKYRVEIRKNQDSVVFYAGYIIGADGANSWVRKKTKLFSDFIMDYSTAKRAYARISNEKDCFELNYISSDCLSYVWQFSLPNSKVNTGIYFSSTHDVTERKNGKAYIEELGSKSNAKVDWSSYGSFPIPTFNSSVCLFSRKGVFLVGDAAGFSDPIFGHGIDIGMLSGKIAVLSIIEAKKTILFNRRKKASQIYNNYVNQNIATKFNNMRKFIDQNDTYNIDDIMSLMRDNMVTNNDLAL